MAKFVINIILPFPVTKPVGGAKIMYEYANRLADNGHTVSIFHSIKRPYKKSKTPTWLKMLIYKLRNVAKPKWFQLHSSIKSVIVPSIIDKYIPNADVTMCTWWQMAYAISRLNNSKGKKFNLIQDYEIWTNQKTLVDESFKLPITHLVIAKYLHDLVYQISGKAPIHIPNAIDSSIFNITSKIEERNPYSIIMLYSKEPRKASDDGIAALTFLQKKYNQLAVTFFGVYEAPPNLPAWINYYQKPINLASLYNQSAIFISPSISEGWALPPAEAMACGCAVVCTNIGGHADYAIDNKTALLVEKNNPNDMAEKIEILITNQLLRFKIANEAHQNINNEFSWSSSVKKIENCFIN